MESRHSALRQRRDFEIERSRRDTRLYISCFGLSQGCGVGVGSRSRMFLAGVETEVVFQYAKAGFAFPNLKDETQ